MQEQFRVIVLGALGGPKENNLPGYLLYPINNPEQLLCLDAGSLLGGIEKAYLADNLSDFTLKSSSPPMELLKKIKAYLISHAHLDHVAALVLNSPADSHKTLLATDPTIDNLKEHLFNWKIWPNYGSEGVSPTLEIYHYLRLPLEQKTAIPHTNYTVTAYQLSHPGDYPSTAFFIEYKGEVILYLGDSSSDLLEEQKRLFPIWEKAAEFFSKGKLRAIFLECSFVHAHSEEVAYGHLNTALFMQEMKQLKKLSGGSIKGLKVVVTHRKELADATDYPKQIEEELEAMNDLGVKLIFPEQGQRLTL